MKLYLDDARKIPEGWVGVLCATSAIEYLEQSLQNKIDITHISLDHDLGEGDKGTGYDVLLWIEKNVVENNYTPPKISIHTANPSARQKMELAKAKIGQLVDIRNE